jgi:dihydroorotase
MSTLITSVKIIDKNSSHHLKKRNVLINKGIIEYIGTDSPKGTQIIEGKDCLLAPGLCDLQATYTDPGEEHKEDLNSGIELAMSGGFTDVALLPNTSPSIQKKNDIKYITKGNTNSLVQLYPIAAISIDLNGEALTDMLDLFEAGAIAFSDGLKPMWNSDLLLKSLQYVKKIYGLVIDRPEDTWLALFGSMHEGENSALLGMKGIPSLAEELAVSRDIEILAYTDGRLHLSNISTEGAVKLIKNAKKRGLNLTCDVAAHQLIYTDASVISFDSNYKVRPPFRSTSDTKALIKGLQDGTIDAIASSHQPHDQECKQLEFDQADFGIIGQQTTLSMLSEIAETIGWELIIDKLSNQPRKILRLETHAIEEGNKANLMLFNPVEEWEFNATSNKSKSENSPLFGTTIKGKVKAVFNNSMQSLFTN